MVDFIQPDRVIPSGESQYTVIRDGIGYNVIAAGSAPQVGIAVWLWSIFSERDGEWVRYAFSSSQELMLAKAIAKETDGVGPKMASRVVQCVSKDELILLVDNRDTKGLSRAAKGLGPAKALAVMDCLTKRILGATSTTKAEATLRALGIDMSDGKASKVLWRLREQNPMLNDEELVTAALLEL